jgi:SAM-dependent methyltransferase
MINWSIKHQLKNFLEEINNKKVLDFGCGDGRYKKYVIPNNEYIGIDVAESGHGSNKNYDVLYNKKEIPFKDETFDAIIFTEVLEHIEDVDLTISELNRVLKTNGKLFVTTPFIWAEHETPYDFQRYTSFGIKKLFEKHGFCIISYKKLVKNKLAIFLIIESELTKYIDSFVSNRFLKFIEDMLVYICKLVFGTSIEYMIRRILFTHFNQSLKMINRKINYYKNLKN